MVIVQLWHTLLGWVRASEPHAAEVSLKVTPYSADWPPRWADRVISRRADPLGLLCSRQCHSRPTDVCLQPSCDMTEQAAANSMLLAEQAV